MQAKCLLETCQDIMSPDDRQIVMEFTEYKKKISNRISLIRHTLPCIREGRVRLLFILSVMTGAF